MVQHRFYSQVKASANILGKDASAKNYQHLSPGTPSWMDEFCRLAHHVPQLLVHEESVHPGGVNDVQFSEDGSMFATCGQDGR